MRLPPRILATSSMVHPFVRSKRVLVAPAASACPTGVTSRGVGSGPRPIINANGSAVTPARALPRRALGATGLFPGLLRIGCAD